MRDREQRLTLTYCSMRTKMSGELGVRDDIAALADPGSFQQKLLTVGTGWQCGIVSKNRLL